MKFVRPCKGDVTSFYGRRTHPVTGEPDKMHWGVDYGNTPENNYIVAAADGVVEWTRETTPDGYGKYIRIAHRVNGRTIVTLYAHLDKLLVRRYQQVKAGEKIGIKGNTGVGTGTHLHFEVHEGPWDNKYTNATNPMIYVPDEGTKQLQQDLKALGYKVAPDGIGGNETIQAVKNFQRDNGLTTDGSPGTKTRAAMERKLKALGVNKPKPPAPKPTQPAVDPERVKEQNDAWAWAKEQGYLDGTNPNNPLTRKQLATVLYRLDKKGKL